MIKFEVFSNMVATTPIAPGPLRVLIAMPVQGGQIWCETADLLMRTYHLNEIQGVQFDFETFGGMGVATARNELAHIALERGHHAILWWDSDIIATWKAIPGLIRHGQPLVGGMYRHKTEERKTWVANFLPGVKPDADGLLEVEDCGAGFLWCSTALLRAIIRQKLVRPYTRGFARPKPPGTVMHDFFSMGVINDPLHNDEATYKTEDFMLAHHARRAGFKCYVDTQVRVDHLGVHKFRADAPGMPEPWTVQASPQA